MVRSVAERRLRRHKRLRNCCLVVSYACAKVFSTIGVEWSLVGGWYRFPSDLPRLRFGDPSPKLLQVRPDESHCWLKIGGNYLDLTLTQFEPEADPVSVVVPPDARYSVRTIQKSLDIARFNLEAMGGLVEAEMIAREAMGHFPTPEATHA